MRRLAVVLALAGALLGGGVAAAVADDVPPPVFPSGLPSPGDIGNDGAGGGFPAGPTFVITPGGTGTALPPPITETDPVKAAAEKAKKEAEEAAEKAAQDAAEDAAKQDEENGQDDDGATVGPAAGSFQADDSSIADGLRWWAAGGALAALLLALVLVVLRRRGVTRDAASR